MSSSAAAEHFQALIKGENPTFQEMLNPITTVEGDIPDELIIIMRPSMMVRWYGNRFYPVNVRTKVIFIFHYISRQLYHLYYIVAHLYVNYLFTNVGNVADYYVGTFARSQESDYLLHTVILNYRKACDYLHTPTLKASSCSLA